jgi:hypothetical protein
MQFMLTVRIQKYLNCILEEERRRVAAGRERDREVRAEQLFGVGWPGS